MLMSLASNIPDLDAEDIGVHKLHVPATASEPLTFVVAPIEGQGDTEAKTKGVVPPTDASLRE